MPDFFIKSSAMPSILATAFSIALSGNGIAGTNGGGTSESVGSAFCADGLASGADPELHAASSDTTAAMATNEAHAVLALITASTLAGYRRHHGLNVDGALGAMGSTQGCGASRNVAQWIGSRSPLPASAMSRWARTASSGFMWMSGHAGW